MPETRSSTSELLSRSLSGQFRRGSQKIHSMVEPLSTDQLWTRPYPYGNSVGHLLLHLTGNLNYYIGAQMAGTGYVRDRPREFNAATRRSTGEVLDGFDRAIDLVVTTLAQQEDDDWAAPFSGVGAEDISDRFAMFLRCAAHADHHAGQIIYLCKQLTLAG